jgi:hypothetical protein
MFSTEPWMHALMFMVGCAGTYRTGVEHSNDRYLYRVGLTLFHPPRPAAGNYYPKLEKELVEDVNELRAQRGLPPMVGTGAWIKYRPPEGEDMQISFQKK